MPATVTNPKFFLSIGGFFGFMVALASGLWAGTEMSLVIRDASFGCVLGAFLMRNLLHVVNSSIGAAVEEKSKEDGMADDNSDANPQPE